LADDPERRAEVRTGFQLFRYATPSRYTGATMLDARDHHLSGPMGISARQGKFIVGLVAVALVAALWLILVDQVRFERQRMVAAAIVQNENRATAFRQYVARTLDFANIATDDAMKSYGPRVGAPPGAAAPPRLIDDPALTNPIFSAVNVIDAGGRLLATTHKGTIGTPSDLDAVAWAPGAAAGHLSVSAPVRSRQLGDDEILLTRSFAARGGSAGTRVSILVKPAVFTDMARGAVLSQGDLISLTGTDGVVRIRVAGARISWGERISRARRERMGIERGDGTYVAFSALDGTSRFFSHRRVPGYPLYVTSGHTVGVVMAPLAARERTYLGAAILLTMAIFAAAWALIAGIARREDQVAALAAINHRLQEAQRIGAMSDWGFDAATGQLRWSPHLYEMYERDPADRVTQLADIRAYASAEDSEGIRQGIMRVLTTGARQEYSLEVTLPSGARSTRHIVAVATRNAEGAITGIHGTDHDITAQRKLREVEAKLAHHSRVDAMNAMASTLAHELNQPLAIATNYLAACRRLLKRAANPPETRVIEAIETAATQVRNAGEIIRGVRAVVSGSGGAKHYVSLTAICADAEKILRSGTPKQAFVLSHDIAPGADMIMAVAVQIQQILMNLIHNSLDAGATMSNLKIVVKSERVSDEVVAISVTDNGPGIPIESRELFSAFFTTKESGLGLGLSICRTLVEAQGGEIGVEKTGPGGTTIRFTLASPVLRDEAAGDAAADAAVVSHHPA
jgi:signal transduction histidine kinase